VTAQRDERRLAAILAADVVGFTRLMGADESGTLARLKALRGELVDPKIAVYGGRIVKLMGDGMLAEFPSVVDAVQCAVEVQGAMAERETDQTQERRIQFRIGVNLGDVIIDGDDIYGDGVNIAARLEGLAQPGGICLSRAARDQIRDKLPVQLEDLGEHEVKNVARPVRVFRVAIADGGPVSGAPATTANAAPGAPEKPSIAVLPFNNMSGDADQEYFADGITEDIITALSKNRWLLVIARNSTFVYKGQSVDVRSVAEDLGAKFVLEGSVRKAGNRVRITAQLIDAPTGNHIWADRYDRDLDDIFAVQDEITATIAARIEPEVGAAERQRVENKSPQNLDAWDSYHLGLSCMYRYTKEGNGEAQGLFRRVIEIDPSFAAAHAGLAYTMFLSAVYFGAEPDTELLDGALGEAQEAVKLDDKDAMSYFIMGRIRLIRREYELSIADLETAIELNPCLATAHCGLGDSLAYSGRLAEAIPRFEEAIRLSPHDPRRWAFLVYGSLALLFLERYEEAAEWANRAVGAPNATFWAYAQLVAVLSFSGRIEEARVAVEDLLRREPEFSAARFAEKFLFYVKDSNLIEKYVGGLRRAGLPE
jgi:TolB-like protein